MPSDGVMPPAGSLPAPPGMTRRCRHGIWRSLLFYLLHFRFSNCYLDKIQQHCVEKKFKVLGSAGELQIIITCLEFNHTIWRTDDFMRLNV